jgi:adenylate cyclase class IV
MGWGREFAAAFGTLALAAGVLGCIQSSRSGDVEATSDGESPLKPESRVEIKLTVRNDQIDEALSLLGLAEDDAEARDVFFYDTLELDFYQAGLILRARNIHGGDDESTVKLRPLDSSAVASRWWRHDFKCELDRTEVQTISSCSLTTVQGEDEIEDVAAGERDIKKLFTSAQEELIARYAEVVPAWGELEVLGPVEASVWKLEPDELSAELVTERWTLPDGSELLELSVRVDADEASDAEDELMSFIASLGLQTEPGETKTRAALEYFTDSQL